MENTNRFRCKFTAESNSGRIFTARCYAEQGIPMACRQSSVRPSV